MRLDSTRGLKPDCCMRGLPSKKGVSHATSLLLSLLLILAPLVRSVAVGQSAESASAVHNSPVPAENFRLELVSVDGGAELITVFAKLDGLVTPEKWVPLVTVLRDTLGDTNTENDRLRYVWPLTYTRPTLKQRVFGAIPFLYTRVGNKKKFSEKSPPVVMDLAAPESDVWNKIFWTALQNILLDPYGMPVKASTRSYQRNISDYRKAHIIRALSVLSLYQTLNGQSAFSASEIAEIHSRLSLSDKTFGGLVDDLNLQRYYEKSTIQQKDERGHNWELLRQRAEAESLCFEPLQLPDGSTTHALLWIARRDLGKKPAKPFSNRFLNVSNPWSDKRLINWKGYSETRYFDAENRPVTPETSGAEAVEMIPIALYGLDNPKIPMLLIDFRDGLNPKKREMSRRVLQDVTRNLLAVSRFGNLPYFLGRTVFDFVTGRRGIDLNQPSRLRTYSQLKLLLALDNSLKPELREQITDQLERVSLNPLENDLDVEAKIASQQYEALLAYAKQSDGLPARLERDRRVEMVPLEHGREERIFFRVASILSFGKYVHREDAAAPDVAERLDIARRISYHTKFLRQVAKSDSQIDVAWNLAEVRRSLSFIADHGAGAGSSAVIAASRIFTRTRDEETRHACLESLSRIASPKAKSELLRISQNRDLDPAWKDAVNSYISKTNQPGAPTSAISAKSGAGRSEQQ
jgi:hypothetical protein